MPGDIAVCIKQVPHPDHLSRISLNERGTLVREGVPVIVNPLDRNALEEALHLREKLGGKIIAFTMGPPQARKALEDALAMGADSAVHLCDKALAGADTLATAQALAFGVNKLENVSVVLCGNSTIDSGTGQVAVQLAELLGFPCAVNAEEIIPEDGESLLVKRAWERGNIKVRLKLPAVIAVTGNINQPHLPGITDIMAVARKEIKEWQAADFCEDTSCLGIAGSPTCFWQTGEFHAERKGEVLSGDVEQAVETAVSKIAGLELI
jgi:electron transfer flavoprotein beta subunit